MNPRAPGAIIAGWTDRAPASPHELPALIAAANQVFRPSGGDMGTRLPAAVLPRQIRGNLRGDQRCRALSSRTPGFASARRHGRRDQSAGRRVRRGLHARRPARARAGRRGGRRCAGPRARRRRWRWRWCRATGRSTSAWGSPRYRRRPSGAARALGRPPDVGVGVRDSSGVESASGRPAPRTRRCWRASRTPSRCASRAMPPTGTPLLRASVALRLAGRPLDRRERAGRPAGYLAVARRGDAARVLELAGDRDAAAGRGAAGRPSRSSSPGHDAETARAAERAPAGRPPPFALADGGSQWLASAARRRCPSPGTASTTFRFDRGPCETPAEMC